MKPAFCAGIVQLSISRKRAMKSSHPAESGALLAKLCGCFRETHLTKMAVKFLFAPLLHPSKL